jgi:hypothetical protein
MGIPSKTCPLKQVNPFIGPQVKTLVDRETPAFCGSPDSVQVYFLIVSLPLRGRGNSLPRLVYKVLNLAKSIGVLASKGCQRLGLLSILLSMG